MNNHATVGDILDALSKMPRELPCYFRPKYAGTVEPWEDVPVLISGIAGMEPDDKTPNVTFLC